MFCIKCGQENQVGAIFCRFCGERMETFDTPSYDPTITQVNPVPSAEVTQAESQAVLALIFGIVGIVTCWFVVGLIFGILGLVKGKKARLVLPESNHNHWLALAGFIMGIIGLSLSIFFALYWIPTIGLLIYSILAR